ncbi:major facilitator superfamily protein [Escherichia coli]|nr:major facilitator superfamily protein [Escherichia coli]
MIYTWLPTIAQTIGLEDALTASLMLNALLIVGALLGLVLTHLLAHRKFLLGSFLLLAATLVVMACLPSGSSLTLLLFVLFSTTISAVSNLVGILPAESFLLTFARWASVFATAMSRLGAAEVLACCRGCWRSGECKSPYCSWRQCCWLVLL